MQKIVSFMLVFCMVLFAVTGCTEVETDVKDADTVGEVYIYAETVIEDYEERYGAAVWGADISAASPDGADMEDLTRRDIIEDIVHVKMLVKKAPELKIALSDEDDEVVDAETDTFYEELTDKEISDKQLSYDLVHHIIEENILTIFRYV